MYWNWNYSFQCKIQNKNDFYKTLVVCWLLNCWQTWIFQFQLTKSTYLFTTNHLFFFFFRLYYDYTEMVYYQKKIIILKSISHFSYDLFAFRRKYLNWISTNFFKIIFNAWVFFFQFSNLCYILVLLIIFCYFLWYMKIILEFLKYFLIFFGIIVYVNLRNQFKLENLYNFWVRNEIILNFIEMMFSSRIFKFFRCPKKFKILICSEY